MACPSSSPSGLCWHPTLGRHGRGCLSGVSVSAGSPLGLRNSGPDLKSPAPPPLQTSLEPPCQPSCSHPQVEVHLFPAGHEADPRERLISGEIKLYGLSTPHNQFSGSMKCGSDSFCHGLYFIPFLNWMLSATITWDSWLPDFRRAHLSASGERRVPRP